MARLRIGLDARMDRPWLSGVGRYARALVSRLTALEAPDLRWVVIKHPSRASARLAAPGSDAEEAILDGDLDTPANLLAAPALHRLRLDLYHALENFLPLRLRVPRVVVTTHDLVWVTHPELAGAGSGLVDRLHGAAIAIYGPLSMRHAYRRADSLIAVSEATRAEALRRFSFLAPDKISTILPGVTREPFPPRAGAEPREPYLVVLGNARRNKNVAAAISALARLADRSVRLIVAGRGDGFPALRDHAERAGVAGAVEFLMRPDDERVLALLHGARALVFPSLVEGFGSPPLEAMSAGCPVIASAVSAVEEMCADAALYCDPRDPGDIARAMRELLASPGLRAELRERGYRRVERFSWERCAAETLQVYRRLLLA